MRRVGGGCEGDRVGRPLMGCWRMSKAGIFASTRF